jgi:hypothetical protein
MKTAAVRVLTAALPLLASGAALAQANGLIYPNPGTVCDQVGRVCYDSYGPSVGITAEIYGPDAGNTLARNLSQSSNSRDFRLSTGQACSVAERTCWNDGWGKSKVATGLTQQLFGSVQAAKQVSSGSGLCSLSRGSMRVFDGGCTLKQVKQGSENRYEVKLENGNRYVFKQQGSNFVINDGFGGNWPATFVDHGNTGIFRFGDYKLVATQNNGAPASNANGAVGTALGNLLNALFK